MKHKALTFVAVGLIFLSGCGTPESRQDVLMALAVGMAARGTAQQYPPPPMQPWIYQPRPVLMQPVVQPAPGVIVAHIEGAFEGWTGNTAWVLDNGQIWQQAQYSYHYHYAYNPEVTIFTSNASWFMRVAGDDAQIQVQRIK